MKTHLLGRNSRSLTLAIGLSTLLTSLMGSRAMAQALPTPNDPCMLAGATDVSSSQLNFTDPEIILDLGLSKAQRLQVMCDIKNAVVANYSLITLKKERLGIDVVQVLENCAANEVKIADTDRQNFFDRVQLCIATFQDTHFSASSRTDRPTILTAIIASDVGGKVVILRQSPKLIARIKADDPDTFATLEQTLAPGNEITQINGAPAADAVNSLIPYVQASSLAYTRIAATQSLFARNFLYPTTRTITIQVKTLAGETKELELPWFAQTTVGNLDAQMKFKALGIPIVNDLQMTYDPTAHRYVKDDESLWTVGYTSRTPMFTDYATLTTWLDDAGAAGLRTGEVIIDRNHAFCYMQLLTFESVNFTESATKTKAPFMLPIETFVANCEAKKLPMIFDLKLNGGGNGNIPAQVLSALSQAGSHYGPDVQAFPATTSMMDLMANGIAANATGARVLDQGPDATAVLSGLADALRLKVSTTDIFKNPDITADPKVGGYSQKILAVISPICISACDMTAHLLKNSGRAVLFGSPSNGTGAGFMSQAKLDSNFQDSLGLLKFNIPNFLFGVETKAGDPSRLPYDQYKELLTENHPTPVDIPYALTPIDLATNGKQLEVMAVMALFAAPN